MESKTSNQTKARLIVLAVFVIGLMAGALSMNLYQRATNSDSDQMRERGRPQDHITEKLTRELNLSAEQREQIRAILEETFNQYTDIKKDIEPRIDAVRQQGRNRMRAVLTPEQLPKFEEMVQKQDSLREKYNDKKK